MTFAYPEFWNYPPYFTLQPVAETQEKQKALWRGLILNYCQSTRTFRIRVDDEKFEPFHNRVIDSESFLCRWWCEMGKSRIMSSVDVQGI